MNTIAIRADLSEKDRTRVPHASSAQVAREATSGGASVLSSGMSKA
jgi:hypothetical protein